MQVRRQDALDTLLNVAVTQVLDARQSRSGRTHLNDWSQGYCRGVAEAISLIRSVNLDSALADVMDIRMADCAQGGTL
jgi:hypothetical protein